jgi:hypothetical protein
VEEKEQRRAPDAELLKRIANAASRFKTSEIEKRVVELNMFRYESGGDLVELADGSERKLGVWRDGRKAFINHFKLETVPKPQVLEQQPLKSAVS